MARYIIKLKHVGKRGVQGQGVPSGGAAGQILTKDSSTDYDTSWQDSSEYLAIAYAVALGG